MLLNKGGRMIKQIFVILLLIIVIIALGFGFGLLDLEFFKFFAPKYQNVKREVFLNTRSYNEAAMQDLTKYRLEYIKANTMEEKAAIVSLIRHRFAEYDSSKLPQELRKFLDEIRYGN